jgi:hypothetical protein
MKDEFWIEKFNKASLNKFPPFFSYSDGILYNKREKKEYSLDLTQIEPEDLNNSIIEFFHKYGNIYSNDDINNVKNNTESESSDDEEEEEEDKEEVWTEFSKKNQMNMIYYYVDKISKKMKLSNNESEQMKQLILLNISNKIFNKSNIIVKDSKIVEFTELFWDKTNREFYVNPALKVKAVKITRSLNKDIDYKVKYDVNRIPYFLAEWEKYCQYLEHKIDKYRSRIVSEVPKRKIIIVNHKM